MTRGILGRKVGMTQIFDESGQAIPVTVIQAGPCHVLQLRTAELDGYEAVQLGYDDKKRPKEGRRRSRSSQASRSERGHVANISSRRSKSRSGEAAPKAGCEPKKFIRELRGASGYEVGQEVRVDVLAEVKAVDVTGTSKGRGYQGVIKRHGFAGQRTALRKCTGTPVAPAAVSSPAAWKRAIEWPGNWVRCVSPPGISAWCEWMQRTTCSWSAEPFRAPMAATW